MAGLDIALWIVSGLLAFMYLMAGFMKASNPVKAKEMGPTLAVQSDGKLRFIGSMEMLGAIGLILPVALGIVPLIAAVAALGLVTVQAFAIPAHYKNGDTEKIGMNYALLLLALFVALGRFGVF